MCVGPYIAGGEVQAGVQAKDTSPKPVLPKIQPPAPLLPRIPVKKENGGS